MKFEIENYQVNGDQVSIDLRNNEISGTSVNFNKENSPELFKMFTDLLVSGKSLNLRAIDSSDNEAIADKKSDVSSTNQVNNEASESNRPTKKIGDKFRNESGFVMPDVEQIGADAIKKATNNLNNGNEFAAANVVPRISDNVDVSNFNKYDFNDPKNQNDETKQKPTKYDLTNPMDDDFNTENDNSTEDNSDEFGNDSDEEY